MATKISAFEPVPDMPGLFTATKNNLRCTAIVLRSGQICLFSPVSGLSDAARASLSDIGDVSFLLAPNGFHNGGLVEYSALTPTRLWWLRPRFMSDCMGAPNWILRVWKR